LRSGAVLPTWVAALASYAFEIVTARWPERSWTPASWFAATFHLPWWSWWALLGLLFTVGFLGSAVERVVKAEAERDAALDKGSPAPPVADMTVKTAVAYLADQSFWGVAQKATTGNELLYSRAKDEFEEAASKAGLKVWGRPQHHADYVELPNTYWAVAQLDLMDLMRDNRSDGRTEEKLGLRGFVRYEGLRVSRAQVESLWPRHS
jgi:hypothetical protein